MQLKPILFKGQMYLEVLSEIIQGCSVCFHLWVGV